MRLLSLLCTLIGLQAANPDIEFAGPAPGKAQSKAQGDVFTLENDVLSASWEVRRGRLQPATIVDKTTGAKVDQRGAELFRLSTTPVATGDGTYQVEINLEEEIATFPRADFPGEPKLVRVGKMNLSAWAR
ncbi:MAG: Alpha-galactosidase [Verrucomicrobiota bacterium]